MKHPAPEEWMDYLYQETPATPALKAHLAECETCRQQLSQWQLVKTSLDSWQLPGRRRLSRSLWGGRLRWAAAALVFLSLGFFAHDLATPPPPDLQSLAATVEPIVRQSLQASISQQLQEQWQSDLQVIQGQMDKQQVEFQHLVLSAIGQSTTQTKKALSGVLAAYQQERQQWVHAIQVLQFQRESDQRYFHNNLARLVVATGQEIQRANAGIRALATSAQFDPEANELP